MKLKYANGYDDYDDINDDYNDLPSIRYPRHFQHLPYLRTVEDILNGVNSLPPCVDGSCSICQNTSKTTGEKETIVHYKGFHDQEASTNSRSLSNYQPKYKHLNKKKKISRRKKGGGKKKTTTAKRGRGRSRSRGRGRSRSRGRGRGRGKASSRTTTTARRSTSRATDQLSNFASSRGFRSNFATMASTGFNTVGNDNPEFNTANLDSYDVGSEVNAGSIMWEGAGSMGISG